MKPIIMTPNLSPEVIEQDIPKPVKCQCGHTEFTYKEDPSSTKKGSVIPYFQCNNCGNKHVKIWWLNGIETRKPRIV